MTWETPDVLPHNYWSPFENRDYFSHQVRHAVETIHRILKDISSFDLFRLCIPSLVLLPVLLWLFGWKGGTLTATWVVGTVAIYAAGFTFVHYEDRYILGFLWPLCCIYVVGFGTDCFQRMAARLQLPSYSSLLISTLLVASFAVMCAWASRQLVINDDRTDGVFRQIGQELRRAGCDGAIAATYEVRYPAMFSAYHMTEQFLGCPAETQVTDVEDSLRAFGVRMFFVDGNADWSKQFRQQTSWHQRFTFPLEEGDLFIYVPPTLKPSHSGPRGAGFHPWNRLPACPARWASSRSSEPSFQPIP